MLNFTEENFKSLGDQGFNRIPLSLSCFSDLDTPLSLYLKLANQPNSFLLESMLSGDHWSRYSFIGLPARTLLRSSGNGVEVLTDNVVVEQWIGNPIDFIDEYIKRFLVPPASDLPRFFGGLAGYFAYDTVKHIEKRLNTSCSNVSDKCSDPASGSSSSCSVEKLDPIGTPDILLLLTEELVIVDNLTSKIHIIVYTDPSRSESYSLALDRLREIQQKLRSAPPFPIAVAAEATQATRFFSKENYLAAVSRAKEYILAGDVMQVQIGQLIQKPFAQNPLNLYRALRAINPSPYMYFYDFGDFHLVGSSPEILVRQESTPEGERVTVRPLAGTRPRGKTFREDDLLTKELLADPKEIAEHVMLIDLARNDVGRIAVPGSVSVTQKFGIEKYSHVMHIVSSVEGMLKPGMSCMDVFRATFPAGTLSGAPKIRAMELIEELEHTRRGIYGGACGYLSFSGSLDLAIAIRTAIIKDGMLYAQAAAGIVADSIPEKEWEETEHKAKAVLNAADLVQAGLDCV